MDDTHDTTDLDPMAKRRRTNNLDQATVATGHSFLKPPIQWLLEDAVVEDLVLYIHRFIHCDLDRATVSRLYSPKDALRTVIRKNAPRVLVDPDYVSQWVREMQLRSINGTTPSLRRMCREERRQWDQRETEAETADRIQQRNLMLSLFHRGVGPLVIQVVTFARNSVAPHVLVRNHLADFAGFIKNPNSSTRPTGAADADVNDAPDTNEPKTTAAYDDLASYRPRSTQVTLPCEGGIVWTGQFDPSYYRLVFGLSEHSPYVGNSRPVRWRVYLPMFSQSIMWEAHTGKTLVYHTLMAQASNWIPQLTFFVCDYAFLD